MAGIPHTCEFCAHGKATAHAESILGYECHRNSPRPMMLIGPRDVIVKPKLVWPILESKGGCGDWKGMIDERNQS